MLKGLANSCCGMAMISLLAGCQGGGDPAPEQASSQTPLPIKSSGHFSCYPGHPGNGFLIRAHAEVAASANKKITLKVPPSAGGSFNPGTAMVRCQVDQDWCGGASCGSTLPVDFYGEHGGGLTWEASTLGDTQSATYTALVHNGDKVAHTVTLVIEMAPSWHLSDSGNTTQQ